MQRRQQERKKDKEKRINMSFKEKEVRLGERNGNRREKERD